MNEGGTQSRRAKVFTRQKPDFAKARPPSKVGEPDTQLTLPADAISSLFFSKRYVHECNTDFNNRHEVSRHTLTQLYHRL